MLTAAGTILRLGLISDTAIVGLQQSIIHQAADTVVVCVAFSIGPQVTAEDKGGEHTRYGIGNPHPLKRLKKGTTPPPMYTGFILLFFEKGGVNAQPFGDILHVAICVTKIET